MSQLPVSSPIDDFRRPPVLSFAVIRWIAEEEVVPDPVDDDEDDHGMNEPYTQEKEMFDVVGEQYRLGGIEAAIVADEDSFLPTRFWLLCEDDNPHDANAVSVHAVTQEDTYQVGFLSRRDVELYRQSLRQIGRANETVEVVGCFTQGKDKPHPNCRLFLPMDFAVQVQAGVPESPENNPAWLRNPDPIEPRPFQGVNAAGFTDDELRKIFCRHAKRKRWFGLPHHCDAAAEGYRSTKMAEELEEFLLNSRPAMPTRTESSREIAKIGKTQSSNIVPARKRGESRRSRPAIVTEEQIDLPGTVLQRPHNREYGQSIFGWVSLTMLRRTSGTEDGVDVQGILRFEIHDDHRRNPSFVEVDLADMFGVLEGIHDAVMAVAGRVNQPPSVAVTIPLSKKLAIVVRTGERHDWTFHAHSIEFLLRFGVNEYLIIQNEQFIESLARAAGAEQTLKEQIERISNALRMPLR